MSSHDLALPVNRKLLTPGMILLLVLMAIGAGFGVNRFLFGLEKTTGLNQNYPWGIWIVADVSFIALGAGGFVTAAIAHVFNRHQFHALVRPALIIALLGYNGACVALAADLGRYYNIWHPILPNMWQGNSALFEVGICVVCYVTVLWVEFIPVVCERFMDDMRMPTLSKVCRFVHGTAGKVMWLFILLGVCISCFHQSSLGHVMVLSTYKLHPLWYTKVLAALFLTSAVMAGIPTVIFGVLAGSWAMKVKPDMKMLSSFARYAPLLITAYLGFKVADMLIRGSYTYLFEGSIQSVAFMIEMLVGLVIPLAMFISLKVRTSPKLLALACALVMFGVVLNRTNVYWIGYQPPFVDRMYFPSWTEWGLTLGTVAGLIFMWRALATYFPILTVSDKPETV